MYPGKWGRETPDHPAVIMAETGETMTHGELDACSNQLAHLFRNSGLTRGDHIAVLMENHLHYIAITWAALRSGLYVTPINWHLTADEAGYIAEDCEAQVLISSALCAGIADQISAPGITRQIMIGAADGLTRDWDDYDSVLAGLPKTPIADESMGSTMFYSSGTTGRPKGVLRPLPDTPAQQPGPNIASPYGFAEDSIYLSPAPLYHASPLSFCREATGKGGTVVVMDKFDAAGALQAIERYKVTHSQWVPTMLIRMLALPEEERLAFDLSSQKIAVHAAAPCPKDVKYQMFDWWGPIIHEFYGGSEGIGVTRIGPEDWLAHPGSVGKVEPGQAFILDDDDNELPAGERGEIFFKPRRVSEYKGDEKKTSSSTSPQGYKTYGDVGYIDEDGFLYLTDRKSFMIISGGVNIYPRETEDVLQAHPAVADCGVFGIPHPDLGEEVKAAVELHADHTSSPALEEQIIAFCLERLAKFKCPRSIDFHEVLPRLPSGKLRKADLRAPYLDGADAKKRIA